MQILNRQYLIQHDKRPAAFWDTPERVLQFGTGVLLRGLCDYVIDQANQKGVFSGRIAVVKSTNKGSLEAFEQQDCAYTLCMRGYQNGQVSQEFRRIASISRIIEASQNWQGVLELAISPHLEIVLSNTTEMGLRLEETDDIWANPPRSFPAKLLAVLFTRYQAFQGDPKKGLILLPTELINDNGQLLLDLVLDLSLRLGLEPEFIQWLKQYNHFCNTLVDRIVPGVPEPTTLERLQQDLEYTDPLLIVSEPYLLWAIEGNKAIASKLGFGQAHPGVVIQEDISVFRTLKLCLLNAFHTINCGLAWLCGFKTVYQAASDAWYSHFMEQLLFDELLPALPDDIDREQAKDFAYKVLDRFKNPYLEHHWLDISFQYTTKMQTRCIPLLHAYYEKKEKTPCSFVFGMAGFIYFMRVKGRDEKGWFGHFLDHKYYLQDDFAPHWHEIWQSNELSEVVSAVLSTPHFWTGSSLALPGLSEKLIEFLSQIREKEVEMLQTKPQIS